MEQQQQEATLTQVSNLINHNKEIPYNLTADEEKNAIDWAIKKEKELFEWRMKSTHVHPITIEDRMKNEDFESRINKEEVLERANAIKFYGDAQKMRDAERKEKLKREAKQLNDKYTYEFLMDAIKRRSQKYFDTVLEINESNERYIKSLCYFLSDDVRFESEMGYSFKKGLLIRGKYGVGKTHAIKCLAANEKHPIAMYSMLKIEDEVRSEGEFNAMFAITPFESSAIGMMYIDDVGTEEETVNHYGSKINWFKTFIEKKDMQPQLHNRIIISTNLTFDEIEDKYGGRVRSRMAGMFNIITVEGNDFRKSKI